MGVSSKPRGSNARERQGISCHSLLLCRHKVMQVKEQEAAIGPAAMVNEKI